MKMLTFYKKNYLFFYKKLPIVIYKKNSILQIVIYKKTQFLGIIYTPAYCSGEFSQIGSRLMELRMAGCHLYEVLLCRSFVNCRAQRQTPRSDLSPSRVLALFKFWI